MAMRKTAARRKTAAKRTVGRKTVQRKTGARRIGSARRKTTARKLATPRTALAKVSAVKREIRLVTKNATPVKTAFNKSQLAMAMAEETTLNRKEVNVVFESLTNQIERHISKNGAGSFTLPGLMKVVVIHKPATKARKGINPFTGEETMFKAKPARNVVKIRALKKLKDMVS